jgi:hypothetical protein
MRLEQPTATTGLCAFPGFWQWRMSRVSHTVAFSLIQLPNPAHVMAPQTRPTTASSRSSSSDGGRGPGLVARVCAAVPQTGQRDGCDGDGDGGRARMALMLMAACPSTAWHSSTSSWHGADNACRPPAVRQRLAGCRLGSAKDATRASQTSQTSHAGLGPAPNGCHYPGPGCDPLVAHKPVQTAPSASYSRLHSVHSFPLPSHAFCARLSPLLL